MNVSDAPLLNLVGNNVYLFNWLSHEDSTTRYTQIMSTKPTDSVSLESVYEHILPSLSLTKNILTQYLSLQMKIIKYAHLLPSSIHTDNIYYNIDTKQIYFTNYSTYKFFYIVDRDIKTTTDIAYRFDPTIKPTIVLKNEQPITILESFELTDLETERLLTLSLLSLFNTQTKTKQLHYLTILIHGVNECIKLYEDIMNDLCFNTQTQVVIKDILTNDVLFFHAERALKNWLGGPYGNKCSSHKMFSYMKVCQDKFTKLYNDIDYPNNPIFKLSRDEFWAWKGDINNTTSNLYRQLAYMLYLGYNPYDEFKYTLSYVYRNMKKLSVPLYRCETTNRFTDDDLKPSHTIYWENLIPATEHKEYALSYLNNARGSNFLPFDGTNTKHILFIFNNTYAAHLKSYYSDYTTYVRSYNANDPEDVNRLNCFNPCALMISNEYIVEPFKKFTITKTYTMETNVMEGVGLITKNPSNELKRTNQLVKVLVVELK